MDKFIEKLKSLNLYLVPNQEELVLKSRAGQLSQEDIAAIKADNSITTYIKENKAALLAYLKRQSTPNTSFIKLSPLQEGILFHSLYESNANNYVEQLTADLPEGIELDAFKSAWKAVLNNHTILRSAILHDEASIPLQFVAEEVELPIVLLDLSGQAVDQQFEAITTFLDQDFELGIDLKNPPLMRLTLIKLAEQQKIKVDQIFDLTRLG